MKVYKTKQKRKRTRILKVILPLFSIVFLIIAYLHYVASPIIINATYAKVDSYATTEISKAIKDTIETSNYTYGDFVTINYNNNGDVSSIITNSINLNLLARKVDLLSQSYVDKIADMGVDIPIGTFTCLSFLSGRGSKINFKLVPIGSILTSFRSDFKSAGINQTIHTLSIVINTTISVVLPLSSKVIEFATEAVVCENLIVGNVPNVYLSGELF